MSKKKAALAPLAWRRLDNAAVIFPSIARGADSGVFRLSCELTEPVDPQILQGALESSLRRFPHMASVMRRGLFWYYLEQSPLRPRVEPETTPPCAHLYRGSDGLLFRVSYWKNKFNLEVFHVLADGSGAAAFFQDLTVSYLALRHPDSGAAPQAAASVQGREEDGFSKYYRPQPGGGVALSRAFRLRGPRQPDRELAVVEGVADVGQLLAAAHRYHATLTVYLAAVLLLAIRGEMRQRDLKRPAVLTVPVDLRSYFPSDTARNFFGTIRVPYDFQGGSGTFEDVLAQTAASFRAQLTPERLERRMNSLAALQQSLLLRPIPLFLKTPVLSLATHLAALGETATLSNVGRIQLPPEAAPYVRGCGIFCGTDGLQLCTCTYGSSFHMGFTSVLQSPEVQRRFFRRLVEDGVAVEVRSNSCYRTDGKEE